jgi:predicted transposase YbfD/YdcC
VSERISPLSAILAQIPDPRHARGQRYPWLSLLLLIVVGLLSGANSQRALARWGQHTGQARRRQLGLRRREAPSQPTLHRVLRNLDVTKLEAVLANWLQDIQSVWWRSAVRWIDGIALDGKTLRGARRLGARDAHLLSACSHQLGVVLAQVAMPDTTNEAGAVGALLEALLLEGRTVTMDAAFTQWTVAEQIIRQGGAYLMMVKANQSAMLATIAERTAYLGRCLGQHTATALAHGRIERRTLRAAKAPFDLGWPHARQVLRLERHLVAKRTGEIICHETFYAVTSLSPEQAKPVDLLKLWQAHWRIESVHWLRDAVFCEDHSTTRTAHAHQTLAAFRNLAISLIHVWRGAQVTTAREYYASHPSALFRRLQLDALRL